MCWRDASEMPARSQRARVMSVGIASRACTSTGFELLFSSRLPLRQNSDNLARLVGS